MPNPNSQFVSKKAVATIYFGTLLLALLVTWSFFDFGLEVIICVFLFPLGILAGTGLPFSDGIMLLGYPIYIAIFLMAFLLRTKRIFIIILLIFLILLGLNINGCHLIISNSFVDIH